VEAQPARPVITQCVSTTGSGKPTEFNTETIPGPSAIQMEATPVSVITLPGVQDASVDNHMVATHMHKSGV